MNCYQRPPVIVIILRITWFIITFVPRGIWYASWDILDVFKGYYRDRAEKAQNGAERPETGPDA